MQKSYVTLLHDYYKKMGIHPDNFKCKHQSICREYAYHGKLTETKMSMVGT